MGMFNYFTKIGKFETCEVEFFEVGHTHCDNDQRFSVVGGILRDAPELETKEDFLNCIRQNYEPLKGYELVLLTLGGIRDWKNWLADFKEELVNHTGKGSAHSFKFVPFKKLPFEWQMMRFGTVKESEGLPCQADDIILLVKAFMRDTTLLQNPLVICTAASGI